MYFLHALNYVIIKLNTSVWHFILDRILDRSANTFFLYWFLLTLLHNTLSWQKNHNEQISPIKQDPKKEGHYIFVSNAPFSNNENL